MRQKADGTPIKGLMVYLDKSLHTRLKLHSASAATPMVNIVSQSLEVYLKIVEDQAKKAEKEG